MPNTMPVPRRASIKYRITLLVALLLLASISAVSLLSYIQYTRDFNRQAVDRNQQIIEQVSLNVEGYLNDLYRLTQSPYYNRTVMEALESAPADAAGALQKSRTIESFLEEMMIMPRTDIVRVYVISDHVYASYRTQNAFDDKTDFTQFDWYQTALATKGTVFVPVHTEAIDQNPDFKIFSIVTPLWSLQQNDTMLGVIKADANYTGIDDICDKVDMGRDGGLFIIDQNKNLIYRSTTPGTLIDDGLIDTLLTKDTGYEPVEIGDQPYYVNYQRLTGGSNWLVFSLSSVAELNKHATGTRDMALLFACASAVGAIGILILLLNQFLKPLGNVVGLMKRVEEGDRSVRYRGKARDEIGYLGASFNAMLDKTNATLEENTELLREVYEAELLQKEAQMDALNSQIKPHFIHNTLNTISMLIQSGAYNKAVQTTQSLSVMMRKLASQSGECLLGQEIELIENYLIIQSGRYTDRLSYTIDIPEGFHDYMLPAFVLQPLVENAIIHGCEAYSGHTHIRVSAEVKGGALWLCVEDTGKGIEPDMLSKIQAALNDDAPEPGRAIGLANVNERIRLRFGKGYGLTLESEPGVRTVAGIRLPYPGGSHV